ncbi:type II toxin-antitoxin system PemK/MazF family toxin [Gemmata sp. JC717]|uniref:type II toxin-antitoxin system PemK/MazF family toxin n=1 Tax=Gemmata algarum TaxID=2975278 RepID=UPI0021BB5102|nr:type II toxin-antitoxin system PemK/MazF family toxin [Gemmata algarum]MDY3550964.1 type II toxin-antitoxin system PemK/MazF family toxin [Gemmata algarum]
MVDLGPGIGHEAGGTRPVVIVSGDIANVAPVLVAVVPATAFNGPARSGVVVPADRSGHPNDLLVAATQVRVLDARRFLGQPIGIVPEDLLAKVTFALKVYLDIL